MPKHIKWRGSQLIKCHVVLYHVWVTLFSFSSWPYKSYVPSWCNISSYNQYNLHFTFFVSMTSIKNNNIVSICTIVVNVFAKLVFISLTFHLSLLHRLWQYYLKIQASLLHLGCILYMHVQNQGTKARGQNCLSTHPFPRISLMYH